MTKDEMNKQLLQQVHSLTSTVDSLNLLLEMKKVKDKAAEKGKHSLSYYHYYKFDKNGPMSRKSTN